MLMTICDVSTPLGGAEGGFGEVMTSFLVNNAKLNSETCLSIVTDDAYDARTSFRSRFEIDDEI